MGHDESKIYSKTCDIFPWLTIISYASKGCLTIAVSWSNLSMKSWIIIFNHVLAECCFACMISIPTAGYLFKVWSYRKPAVLSSPAAAQRMIIYCYHVRCLHLHCSEDMPLSLQKELCNNAVNRNLFELSWQESFCRLIKGYQRPRTRNTTGLNRWEFI